MKRNQFKKNKNVVYMYLYKCIIHVELNVVAKEIGKEKNNTRFVSSVEYLYI